MNRVLITLGAMLIVLGAAWSWIRRLPLFRLPGDIIIDRPGFRLFVPLTTMVLISAAISLIAWILRK
jgi:ribose/xylose/arabinose/galactoside ABC-type transport system permease subunit